MVSLKETPRHDLSWAERLQNVQNVSISRLCVVILSVLQMGKGLWLV